MAEANALELTMLQYCEISQIRSVGFEKNLQDDFIYLQKLISNTSFFLIANKHQFLSNSTNWHVTNNVGGTYNLPAKYAQTSSGFTPFSKQQKKTKLNCIRLKHTKQIVSSNMTFVPGTKRKLSHQFAKKRNVNFFGSKKASFAKAESILPFFIASPTENETRIFLKFKMSLI